MKKLIERIVDWVAPMEKLDAYTACLDKDTDIEDFQELVWSIYTLSKDLTNDASIMLSQPMQQHIKKLLGYKVTRLYLTYIERDEKKK